MTNFILAAYVAMVVLFVIGVTWEMNARRRARQSGTVMPEYPSRPKSGRGRGSDWRERRIDSKA